MNAQLASTTIATNSRKTSVPSISITDFEEVLRTGSIADEGIDNTDGFTYFRVLLPSLYWNDGMYTSYYKVLTKDLDDFYMNLSHEEVNKYFMNNVQFNNQLIIDGLLVGEPIFSQSFTDSSSTEC